MDTAAFGRELPGLDRARLAEALSLAEGAIGVSDPNPRVGCVIGFDDGRVVGRGFTQAAGQAHAEVMALQDAHRSTGCSNASLGATAWVTLEPCAHHGRTPPCCDALIAAGISRVVVAALDPNPVVNGNGLARLRYAGLTVTLADGWIAKQARELNIGFFSRFERGRPWVRLKAAVSLDGRMAAPDGVSRWITGPHARHDGHGWRRRAGAILTGIGTVLADDPRLDVREWPTLLQPLRVIVDSGARLPLHARVLGKPGATLIVTSKSADTNHLAAAGAEVLRLDSTNAKLDLPALLGELAKRGINELHVEAGPTLNGSLMSQNLVDELLLYIGPKILGPGLPLASLAAICKIEEALEYEIVDSTMLAPDLRIRLRFRQPS